MAPGSLSHHINLHYFIIALLLLYLLCISIPKIPKILFIISIRSHFRKWPWRDWQPLYGVGCEVLICLCRCVGLVCGLLLDWYIGSQKLREILTLLCYITLSSSKENQRSAQEVAVRHLKRVTCSRSSDSHWVKAGLLQLNPTIPLLIMMHM